MKLEKLLTLSQFVDLIIPNAGKTPYRKTVLVKNYNEFLKQPLKKEMFVNEIKKPKIAMYQNTDGTNDVFQFDSDFKAWQEAEKKVIFKGYKLINNGNTLENGKQDIYVFRDSSMMLKHNGVRSTGIKTIHDLAEATKGELELNNVEL